jgi:hypothetical protein
MVKLNKELTLGVLLVVIVIMVLKPNLLGFLYNNIIGKLIFVAAVVFLSLKHTAAGLLAVVFVAMVASMTGYHGLEGMTADQEVLEGEENMQKEKCEGENCENVDTKTKEGADTQEDLVKEIGDKLKKK